jgi:hypothetical protein
MDEKYKDVGAYIMGEKDHGRTASLRKIKELTRNIQLQKDMALAAFAKVQLSMGNNFAAKEWPTSLLREHVSKLNDHLLEIESMSAQVLVAMSPVEHDMGIGTGITPAELEGARVRSEQVATDGE